MLLLKKVNNWDNNNCKIYDYLGTFFFQYVVFNYFKLFKKSIYIYFQTCYEIMRLLVKKSTCTKIF